MKHAIKKYFIPHAENSYHPHFLHTKRAIVYSIGGILLKVAVFLLVAFLPTTVFVLPEILTEQQIKIITLTNEVRRDRGNPPLVIHPKLVQSAGLKAEDMATGEYFAHVSPENHGLAYFLGKAGYVYRSAGENLGMGFVDAEQLVKAWVNSPTHYANIIDTEFVELGVNLAHGVYDSISTVYAVQHFGEPKKSVISPVIEVAVATTTTSVIEIEEVTSTVHEGVVTNTIPTTVETSSVVSETVEPEEVIENNVFFEEVTSTPIIGYIENESFVAWKENNDGTIQVIPTIAVTGVVTGVYVDTRGHTIRLMAEDSSTGTVYYNGEVSIDVSVHDMFEVVLPLSVRIVGENGDEILSTIAWKNPPVISPTPIEKYISAQERVPLVSSLFAFTKSIYIALVLLFSLALVSMILFEIKKQHPHIILQTMALICLFIVLVVV
jgi:uncharacterized protein YkwD